MIAAMTDPLTFDEAIASLRRYSLLEVEHDTLRVHRLVPHALNAAEYYNETFHVAAEETGRLLDDVGGYLQVRGQFKEARTVQERALALAEATYRPSHPTVGTRLNNLGLVLQDLGELAAARAALERAVQICQMFLGTEHPYTQTVQAHLDAVIQAIGSSPDTA
jgi:Tfp pilus assembly protein PilF